MPLPLSRNATFCAACPSPYRSGFAHLHLPPYYYRNAILAAAHAHTHIRSRYLHSVGLLFRRAYHALLPSLVPLTARSVTCAFSTTGPPTARTCLRRYGHTPAPAFLTSIRSTPTAAEPRACADALPRSTLYLSSNLHRSTPYRMTRCLRT